MDFRDFLNNQFKKNIWLRNKFVIATGLFFLWILIFDENNLIEQFGYMHEIGQLKDDKEYYEAKIIEDSQRLKELKTNKANLEKFAREQFLMKKENEDIFILVKE